MKKTWTVNANGVNHTIEYNGWVLFVDGAKYKLKSANWFVQMIDYAVNFGDVQSRLVVIGNKVDLAVNGRYLGSGQPYEPLASIPAWVSVLSGISCVMGFLLNSWLGLAIGCLLGVLYFKTFLKKKRASSVIIAFVIATVCQIILGFGVVILVSGL